MIIIMIMK